MLQVPTAGAIRVRGSPTALSGQQSEVRGRAPVTAHPQQARLPWPPARASRPAGAALPGGRAGDGAAGVHEDAPAVAGGRVALHRLVEPAVGALRNHHVVVLGLPGLFQGRLLLLVAGGHWGQRTEA